MSKKNKRTIYSTNPDFDYDAYDEQDQETDLDPGDEVLRVLLDRKNRKGKPVTLVTGFKGSSTTLKELGKYLKSKCGVGGAVKDGEILVQGDQRKKVLALLLERGYNKTKLSGG